MIRCCYKCTDRILGCHSTCQRYADEVAEAERLKQLKRDAEAGYFEYHGYKKDRYKSVDRKASRDEVMRRKKW